MAKRIFLLFLTLFFVPSLTPTGAAYSSSYGTINGVVKNASTGEPLIGANVRLQGTALGAATDLKGEYRISRVPVGNYTLVVTFIGYRRESFPVKVLPDEISRQDAELHPEIIKGEEIVVTAQLEGQAQAINRQLSSNTIVNVVSADRIQELPDVNAAESVGRLPGISIKRDGGEGQKVVVRGLSPTFNSVTVNGERLPATDLNDRSVDLNMISPDILAGIEVVKALTPDRDADAVGGIIDFQLGEAPAGGFRTNLRFQNGYNDQQSELGQYKGNLSFSNRFLDNKFGLLVSGNIERAQRGSDQFEADYSVDPVPAQDRLETLVNSVVLKDRIEARKRLGASALLDYKLPSGKVLFSNFMGRLDRDEIARSREYDTGSNWSWYVFRDSDIKVDVLSNSFSGEYSFRPAKIDWSLSRSSSL